jgi:hypothetical protein
LSVGEDEQINAILIDKWNSFKGRSMKRFERVARVAEWSRCGDLIKCDGQTKTSCEGQVYQQVVRENMIRSVWCLVAEIGPTSTVMKSGE